MHPKTHSLAFNILLSAAYREPAEIDSLLRPCLGLDTDQPRVTPAVETLDHSTLASQLAQVLEADISQAMTPPIFWAPSYFEAYPDGEPPSYWNDLRVHATLLGRALSLTYSLQTTNADPDLSSKLEEGFEELWDVAQGILFQSLFRGEHADSGALYATGILILTCSSALREHNGGVKVKGGQWAWYNDVMAEPGTQWSWADLEQAVLDTRRLPQDNTDFDDCLRRLHMQFEEGPNHVEFGQPGQPPWYIHKEAVNVLHLARDHLDGPRDDWTPGQMVALTVLEDSSVAQES